MLIVKIEAYENGAHDNIKINGVTPETFPIPEGWVYVPESVGTMETLENFPFGDFTHEEVDGLPTMTNWTVGVMPEPEPEDKQPTQLDIIEAQVTYTAMMTDTLLEV